MRTNLKGLYGFTLVGVEGEIGKVEDFYIDDQTWRVKFMVVDTGAWLTSRTVVVGTQSVENIEWDSSRFHTQLTREHVRESPEVDNGKYLGAEGEKILVRHYHLHSHWPETGMFGIPPFIPATPTYTRPPENVAHSEESHLVVAGEVMGCSVEATDGHLGNLDDFIVHGAWQVGAFVVKAGSLVLGKKLMVPLAAIASFNWENNEIRLNISEQEAKKGREHL